MLRHRKPAPPPEHARTLSVPDELHEHYRELTARICEKHPRSMTITRSHHDPQRGTLVLTTADGTLALAVADQEAAAQVHAMAQLEPTRVRLSRQDTHLSVIAYSPSWTYALHALPGWATG